MINSAIKFLSILIDNKYITDNTALKAIDTLVVIRNNIPNITIPRIGPGPDGMVGFTWEGDDYHINIEITESSYVQAYIERIGLKGYVDEHKYVSNNTIKIMQELFKK